SWSSCLSGPWHTSPPDFPEENVHEERRGPPWRHPRTPWPGCAWPSAAWRAAHVGSRARWPPALGASMDGTAPTVFVLDDDSTVRNALARLIRSFGIQVQPFASAREVLGHPQPDGTA